MTGKLCAHLIVYKPMFKSLCCNTFGQELGLPALASSIIRINLSIWLNVCSFIHLFFGWLNGWFIRSIEQLHRLVSWTQNASAAATAVAALMYALFTIIAIYNSKKQNEMRIAINAACQFGAVCVCESK